MTCLRPSCRTVIFQSGGSVVERLYLGVGVGAARGANDGRTRHTGPKDMAWAARVATKWGQLHAHAHGAAVRLDVAGVRDEVAQRLPQLDAVADELDVSIIFKPFDTQNFK